MHYLRFWSVLCLLSTTLLCNLSLAHEEPIKVPPDPAQIEQQFVTSVPNVPLAPGSLNLFGYETAKAVNGWPILSPNKNQLVYSQVFFIPDIEQTTSRMIVYPVGKLPKLEEVMSPGDYQDWDKMQKKHPETPQPVLLREVDHFAFWDRYSPEKQAKDSQVLIEMGFEKSKPYAFEVVQPIDWSSDGSKVLVVYRPGVHHSGIFRSIPIVVDINSKEAYRYAALPQTVWNDFKMRKPEALSDGPTTWDIRPLGWGTDDPSSIIVKLVLIKGQNEIPSGFWQYNLTSGAGIYLGEEISEDKIAKNGLLVRFVDPMALGGSKSYGIDELPEKPTPQPPEFIPPKKKKD